MTPQLEKYHLKLISLNKFARPSIWGTISCLHVFSKVRDKTTFCTRLCFWDAVSHTFNPTVLKWPSKVVTNASEQLFCAFDSDLLYFLRKNVRVGKNVSCSFQEFTICWSPHISRRTHWEQLEVILLRSVKIRCRGCVATTRWQSSPSARPVVAK